MVRKIELYTLVSFFSIIIGLSGCIVSKEDTSSTVATAKEKSYCELKSFSAKYYNGRVYLNWVVNTNISNYYFILEKTNVNGKFHVCTKKGFASPIKEGLSYSFIDEKITTFSRTYKLRAVLPVKNGENILLYAESRDLFKDIDNDEITVYNDGSVSVNR